MIASWDILAKIFGIVAPFSPAKFGGRHGSGVARGRSLQFFSMGRCASSLVEKSQVVMRKEGEGEKHTVAPWSGGREYDRRE
jgi:hypothetical protein